MQASAVRNFANALGIKLIPNSTGEWLQGHCPLAPWTHQKGHDNNASFGITHGKKRSHFSCFSCKESGSLAKLALRLAKYRKADYSDIVKEIEIAEVTGVGKIVFPEWSDEENNTTRLDSKEEISDNRREFEYPLAAGHPYLTKRGIGWKTAHLLGIRLDAARKRILFPVYDVEGQFRGFSGRLYTRPTEREPKVRDYFGLPKRKLFLGRREYANGAESRLPLVICEGLFDYAVLRRAGVESAIAIMGTQITHEKFQTLIDLDRPIIWFLDNDLAGDTCLYGKIDPDTHQHDHKTGILFKLRGYVPQKVVSYPAGWNDPGEMPDHLILQMIAKAKPFF